MPAHYASDGQVYLDGKPIGRWKPEGFKPRDSFSWDRRVKMLSVGSLGNGQLKIEPAGTIAWWEHQEVWKLYNRKHHGLHAEGIEECGGFGKSEAEELLGHDLMTWKAT